MIPEYVIQQVKDSVNPVEFLGMYSDLKKNGKDYYGPCPLCSGKKFSVIPKKRMWYCFNCGLGGDALKLVTLLGSSFPDAVATVAQHCGVNIEHDAGPPPDWEKDKAKRDKQLAAKEAAEQKEREMEWGKVGRACSKRYDDAAQANLEHPYLKRKMITSAKGIGQEGTKLLIPMRDALTDKGLLLSLQVVDANGRKLNAEGGRTSCVRAVLGAEGFSKRHAAGEKPTLYICEGWATAWTISHITGDPAVACFAVHNIECVTRAMQERYPEARIIIAADNDRWTKRPNGKPWNPGVEAARAAAKTLGVEIAIPDFKDLSDSETKQTDFNDLYCRNGRATALKWLNPKLANEAVLIAKLAAMEDEALAPEAAEKFEPVTWLDACPFRPIGFDADTYYYLPARKGQISGFSINAHKKLNFISLAPLTWWENYFGSPTEKGGVKVSWDATVPDALFRSCEAEGVYRPERMRGRGCWTDPDGVVIHLGRDLLPPKATEYVKPDEYRGAGDHIYERRAGIQKPAKVAMKLKDANEVAALFRDLLWLDPASGDLMAGWTVLAPIAGALGWRPHVWITGSPGSGKTRVLDKLIEPLLGGRKEDGGFAAYFEAGSTEAGIRGAMRSDSLPIMYDEAEKSATHAKNDGIMQSVLALARSASSASGSAIVKGSQSGGSVSYQMRSMFLLSSVSPGLREEADKTRVSVLQLHGIASIDQQKRRDHWRLYRPRMYAVDNGTGRALIARTIEWLRDGRLAETIRVCQSAAAGILGDTRGGDQYGTLYAGAWTLLSDEPPNEMEARELIESSEVTGFVDDQQPVGRKVLEALLQAGARLEFPSGPAQTFAVGELVDIVRPSKAAAQKTDLLVAAREWMNRHGMTIREAGGQEVLFIGNTSRWVKDALKDTPYADGWRDSLKSVEGVVAQGPQITFHSGLSTRTVGVPLTLLTVREEEG
jgi:putative DNA primase/helicase